MSKKSKRTSGNASSDKRPVEARDPELDFEALLHRDVREIDFAKTLRQLGGIKVTEWDFKDVVPAMSKLANQQIDVVNLFKKAADYRVMEWDFRGSHAPRPVEKNHGGRAVARLEPEALRELTTRLKGFLQYAVANLVGEPDHARIKVIEIMPNVLHCKVVLVKRDVSMLVGTGGHTAAAIRGMLKAAGGLSGVAVLLQIRSHEEETAQGATPGDGRV